MEIELTEKNKSYYYLFQPQTYIYSSNTVDSFLQRVVINTYLADPKYPDDKAKEPFQDNVIYLLCSNKLDPCMYNLEKEQWYDGIYSISADQYVIRMRIQSEKMWKNFIESRYSQIMPDTKHLTYDNFKNRYLLKRSQKSKIYHTSLYALAHSERYFENRILPLISNLPEHEIEAIKNSEYDEPITRHLEREYLYSP